MKKIILALSMLAVVGLSSSYANEDVKVSKRVLSAFQNDFNSAENAKWSVEKNFFKVSFTNMDMQVEAYYDEDGALLGSVRSLSFEQLPLAVIHEYNRRFESDTLKKVVEITNVEGTSYRIWIEKGNKVYKLRANASGEIVVLEKTKK
ncbi:MAG: hypothetical protein JNL23_01455 [Chitinophagaceae bacterium]|nr:hypothetical protein [Chitinophagaceae bacterium]